MSARTVAMRRTAFPGAMLIAALACGAARGAEWTVSNFAELSAAAAGCADGDTITLASAGPFIATANLFLNKSVTVRRATGIHPIIDMTDLYDLILDGKAGGTVQTWVGPITIKSTKANSGSVMSCFCTAGDLAAVLTNLTFVARTPAERRRENGLGATNSNSAFRIRVDAYGCTAYGTSNQGFNARTSPSRFDRRDYVVMNLHGCTSFDNAEEGVSGHDGTTINSYGGTYTGSEEYPSAPGTQCIQTDTDCTLTTGLSTGIPGNDGNGILNISTNTSVVHERCTVRHTRGQVVKNHSYRIGAVIGAASSFTARDCDITLDEDVGMLLMNGRATVLFEDCRIAFAGDYRALNSSCVALSNSSFGTSLTFRRCVLDFSAATASAAGAAPVFSIGGVNNVFTMEGCVLISPAAGFWGGPAADFLKFSPGFGTGSISHCTFIGSGVGAGLHLTDGSTAVRGNVFHGWAAAVLCEASSNYGGTSGYNVYFANAANVQGGSLRAGDWVGDPLFVNPAAKDYRVGVASPAVLRDPLAARQIQSFALDFLIDGSGYVTRVPDGLSPWPGPTDSGAYTNRNVQVQCTAMPTNGQAFCGWSGAASGSQSSVTVTLNSDILLSAQFGVDCCMACDLNCDGSVNPFDIQPFVELLMGTPADCSSCAGDANGDGSTNPFDVAGIIACLGG